jgi:hypothetical protein
MSGSRSIVLTLSTRGADKLRSDLEGLGAVGEATLAKLDAAARKTEATTRSASSSVGTLGGANDNTGRSFDRLGSQIQNASFQVGDFAVQVASGQSAVTALAQQLPQLLGGFGMIGAISGAAVAIGAVAYNMLAGADAAKEFESALKTHEASYKAVEEAAKRRREGLAEEATRIVNLTTYYGTLTEAQRRGELITLEQQRKQLANTGYEMTRNVGSAVRNRVGDPSYGIAPGDAIGDAGASFIGAAPAGVQQAADALARLDDANNRTREGIRGIIADLDAASRSGGSFSSAITATRDEVIRLAPDLERNGEAVKQVKQQIEAASGPLAAFGNGATTAAGQVSTLSGALSEAASRVAALRRAAADNPYADLDRTVATLRAQSEALVRGDNDAADAIERREQARTRNAEQRVKMLDQEAKDLLAVGASEEEIAAARIVSERRIAQTQGDIFRQQEANREQERRNREAEAAARRAASEGRAAARREDAEAARERMAALDLERRIYAEPMSTRYGLNAVTSSDPKEMEIIQGRLRAAGMLPEQTAKAAEEATKAASASFEKQSREAERSFDRISDYAGNAFADLWLETEGGWKRTMQSLERVAVATFAKIAFEAAARPVIIPIVQQFVGGSGAGIVGSALGMAGGASGGQGLNLTASGATGGVDYSSYLNQAGNAASLYRSAGSLFGGSGPGIMAGGYDWASNSIVAGIDGALGTGVGGFLNTPLYTAPLGSAGAGTAVQGFNYVGGAAMGEVGTSTLAGAGGMGTVGSAAAGALGVAAGAYGAYQGIQRGGPGGYTSAAGSAALGGMSAYAALAGSMAAVPVYGWIAAAALMVIGALLPGQKPSDKTGTALIDFASDTTEIGGLTGDRYSQENRDFSAKVGQSIHELTNRIGDAYGFTAQGRMLVSTGARDGLVLRNGSTDYDFTADEQGVTDLMKTVTQLVLEANRGQFTGNLATTFDTVGAGDPQRLLEALDWTKTVYEPFVKLEDQTTQYAQALKQVTDLYTPLIEKAREYGLALEPIASVMDEQIVKLNDARSLQFNQMVAGFDFTSAQLRGDPDTVLRMQLTQFDLQRTADYTAMAEQIKQMGFGAEQIEVATRAFDEMKDLQRQSVIEQTEAAKAQQAAAAAQEASTRLSAEASALQTLSSQGGILQSFLDDQATGGATSPQSAFLAAQSQYAEALERARSSNAETADLGRVTGAAQNLLSASSSFYGDGAQAQMIRSGVLGQVKSLGVDLGLPQFSDRFEDNVTRLITSQTDQVAANQALATEISSLRDEFRTFRLRNAA